MKPVKYFGKDKKSGLKNLIARSTGFATLSLILTSPASILAEEQTQGLEEAVASETHITRVSSTASMQHMAVIETGQMASASDIVQILRENPALLCSLTGSVSADALGGGAVNPEKGSNADHTLNLRGLDNACDTLALSLAKQ